MTMYYLMQDNKIVLYNKSKRALKETIALMPEFANLEIKSTELDIIDFEFRAPLTTIATTLEQNKPIKKVSKVLTMQHGVALPIDKPQNATDLMPSSFGGVKNNWSDNLIQNGYEYDKPAILGGDNLNYMLDSVGKSLKYSNTISDIMCNMPTDKILSVNDENKFEYRECPKNIANTDLSNLSEQGKAQFPIKAYNVNESFNQFDWAIGIVDDEKALYESLKSDNLGNSLTDETSWEKVEFGGGGNPATPDKLGTMKPDNLTTFVDDDGTLHSPKYNLFDLIQKDHILSFEEKEGLERLGEFVYKEAQDGRYGYSDFYQKCIEEYSVKENETEKIYTSSNITTTGHINNRKGVLSGFSTSNFAVMQKPFAPEATDSWEMVFKIRIPDTLPQQGSIIGNSTNDDFQGLFIIVQTSKKIQVNLTSNGTSWDVISNGTSNNTLESNTWYYVRMKGTYLEDPDNPQSTYVLDVSKDKQIWEEFLRYSEKKPIHKATIPYAIGMDNITSSLKPFCGDIDLNESYIKIGENVFWSGVNEIEITKNKNGHRFYDIKDKEKVNKIYQDTGVAWYYGIDTENERILLPRNDYFFQNSEVGKYIEAGLPDHDHKVTDAYTWASIQVAGGSASVANNKNEISTTLASQSNPIYGANKTVQPPSVGVIVYMVVGNTSTKKARSEAIELTSSTNDTLPMFTPIYFDFKPNHPSWIKAGSTLKADIYESAYSELLKIVNGEETKYGEGLKVVKESEKLPDVDYSEYWVINENNQTFTAPLKLSFSPVSSGKVPVIGNGKAITVTNGENNYPLATGTYSGNGVLVPWHDSSFLGHNVGEEISGANSLSTNALAGLTTNPDLSGIVADLSGLKSDKAQLYFKVANALENIEAIDCGEVLEELNNKISKTECKAYIIQTYTNGTSGYRIWSDGYCEQWGRLTTNSDTIYTVNLLKEMKDTNYLCANSRGVTGSYRSGVFGAHTNEPFNFKTTSFDVYGYSIDGINTIQWEVKGYIKEGE